MTIVLCGQIEDDVDNLEEILYTTQGGNDFLCSKNQVNDPVMRLGNLALKVCNTERWLFVWIAYFYFYFIFIT